MLAYMPAERTPSSTPLNFVQMLMAAGIGSLVTLLGSILVESIKTRRDSRFAIRDFRIGELRDKRARYQELIAALYEGQSKMHDCFSWKAALNEFELRYRNESDKDRKVIHLDMQENAKRNFDLGIAELEKITLSWLVFAEKGSPCPDGNEDLTAQANTVRNAVLAASWPPEDLSQRGFVMPNDVGLSMIAPLIEISRCHVKNASEALEAELGGYKPTFTTPSAING